MFSCSYVDSNGILRDRLLRASLRYLEPANQEIPWYPWDVEGFEKREIVVHSESPCYMKRSEKNSMQRRSKSPKRPNSVSVVVEKARGFDTDTMCVSERKKSERNEISMSGSMNWPLCVPVMSTTTMTTTTVCTSIALGPRARWPL